MLLSIGTILGQLNKVVRKPLVVAVFLVFGSVLLNFHFFTNLASKEGETVREKRGILGGPALLANINTGAEDGSFAAFTNIPRVGYQINADIEIVERYQTGALGGSLQDTGETRGVSLSPQGLITYKVVKGDTLSGIAKDFGISVDTIIAANPEVRARTLQVDQELTVLPVSGIVYEVREGETVESIASIFSLKPEQIKEFNRNVNFAALEAGVTIVIPGAKTSFVSVSRGYALPDLQGYFIEPTQGFNWGKLHERNAVDIANNCGTRVSAAAEGLVIESAESGWNSGYGHFILIEHPNGTKTRYSHLDKLTVSIGDYVSRGDDIGTMGNTGNVHGPTGCHLHFEVEGAQNPFAK